MSKNPKENFGKQAKDKVTGFSGIITAVSIYMYGCSQYCLTPPIDKEGKKNESSWFDDGRIEITGKGISVEDVKGSDDGCECRDHGDRH